MDTKTRTFVLSLINSGVSNLDIAVLASVSIDQVRGMRHQPAQAPKLAPVYGGLFNEAPEPTTSFEIDLKDAGKFATVSDVTSSILILHGLLQKARAQGDVEAEYAVVARATKMYFRARSCRGEKKVIQVEALRRFIATATAE